VMHFPLTLMDEANVGSASEDTEKLQARGQTNLSAGLYLGAQELIDHGRRGAVKTILLMTDGNANLGDKTSNVITSKLSEMLVKFENDVTVHTFGYGKDHSEEMLSKISECGNGMYYFIEEISNIGQAYTDCFGGLISTIAFNSKVLIQVPIIDIHLHVSGSSNYTKNGDLYEFNLNELQKDDERDIVISGSSDQLISKNQVKVKFQCRNVIKNTEDVLTIETIDAEKKDFFDCEYQKIRIKTYKALFAALDSRPNAVEILNQLLRDLDSSEYRNSENLNMICNEVNYFLSLIQSNDQTVWKKIVQSAMSHKHQRSSGMELESHKKYRSGARTILLNRYKNRDNYKKCHNCGSNGHYSKDCDKPQMCHNCKGVGHRTFECPVVQTCHNCKQPGHLRQNCPDLKCKKCGNNGHLAKECHLNQPKTVPQQNNAYVPTSNVNTQQDLCFHCGKSGHWARDCPQNLVTQNQPVPQNNWNNTSTSKNSCFNCGKPGHLARDCPQKSNAKNNTSQDNTACYNCGKPGHRARDCTEPKNNNRSGRKK